MIRGSAAPEAPAKPKPKDFVVRRALNPKTYNPKTLKP